MPCSAVDCRGFRPLFATLEDEKRDKNNYPMFQDTMRVSVKILERERDVEQEVLNVAQNF